MLLIAALGNPGPEYQHHRHNVGFMVGEEIRRRNGWPTLKARFRGLVTDGMLAGGRILLLLPMTFMNRSGIAVAEAARFYRIPIENVIAVHDEVELAFGDVRIKEGGGLGGHNGLRSMEQYLGGRDFWRVRVGVGRPASPKDSLADYVLSPFAEPPEDVRLVVYRAADLLEDWVRAGGSSSSSGGPLEQR